MKKCYIMRGLPGSGKDTWIKSNLLRQTDEGEMPAVCSADTFHMKDSKYLFVKEKQAEAHNWCLKEFNRLLWAGCPEIVVNNTNIRTYEIAPYYRLAEAFGYEVEIIHVLADPEVCKKRNVHGVPPETIDAMFKGLEAIPPWWKVRVVMSS